MSRRPAVGRKKSVYGPDHRRRRLLMESLEERRMLAVDWRNPVDALDVDGDRFIVPLDALRVINYLNSAEPNSLPDQYDPAQPYWDVSGDQVVASIDALLVINHLNDQGGGSRKLIEGIQLARETDVTVTLGQMEGSRIFRAKIDANFDLSDQQTALEDVLAVYLVDPRNEQNTLLDRGENGTTLFTLAGSQAEFAPGLVRWDGSILEVDLTGVASSFDTATLRFQLLNSDGDLGTKVEITPLSNDVTADDPTDVSFLTSDKPVAIGGALDLSSLAAANDVEVLVDNVRLDPITYRYKAELRLRNNGAPVGRDVAAIFRGLFQIPGVLIVDVEGASGFTSDGPFPEPYINFRNAIPRGGLAHGMTSDPITVSFFDPHLVAFFIRPEIKANANHAPVANATGPLTVMPGSVLGIPLSAADADGDLVTFALPSGGSLPTGELTAGGKLIFRPTPAQLGTYTFNVIASDGALNATRSVTLNVVADPVTTTRVSGTVLKTNGQPLAGVRIDIGAVQVLTGSDGTFTANLGSGPIVSDTIKIRGDMIAGATTYPFIAEKLAFVLEHDIFEHYNNVIVRPIYLPGLDSANAVQINPAQDTTVTTAAIPGASVFVKAGTLMNQQGSPFTGQLSITEVPSDLTPAALPKGFSVDMVVTIQPGEMAFAAPAQLSLPNRNGYAPGEQFDLWSINPVTGQFDQVGLGKVSPDGSTIDTVSGGIRNSSWHAFVQRELAPQVAGNPRNEDPGCKECKKRKGLTSEVELHSGEVIETHNLVTYQAQGETRGLTLNYDSLRADPRPIISFATDAIPEVPPAQGRPIPTPDDRSRFVASVRIEMGAFSYEIPGYIRGDDLGLYSGEHFWTYTDTTHLDAALQADLRSFPSGIYSARVESGFVRLRAGDTGASTGSRFASSSELISVNSINSPFGAGWGLAGLQSIVVNSNGSVLVIDGDGSEVRYAAGPTDTFVASPGEFSKLERVNGLFRQAMPDKTVNQFNIDNQLATVTDKNGNVTTYQYLNKLLTSITDSVGLVTTFTYTNGRVTTITDPAGRMTTLAYDSAGNLTSITDPDNSRRTWDYDNDHLMIAEVDQLNRREVTQYGFHGRAIGAITKDGRSIQLEPWQTLGLFPPSQTSDPLSPPALLDVRGKSASYRDENGRVSNTPLDGRGQELADKDSFGLLPSVSRDNDSNLPVTSTDGRGNMAIMGYDAQGNLIKRLDSLSGGDGGETRGEINLPGEVDHYSFAGHAGQRLFIDGLQGDSNTIITITDSHGTFIGGTSYFASKFPYYYALLILPYDDVYSLTVHFEHVLEDRDPPGPTTGSYRFRLIDVDDSPTLPLNAPLVGSANENQLFHFTGQRGQTIELLDQSGAVSGIVQPYVFGPDGRKLERIFTSNDIRTYEFLISTPGTYYVLLDPFQTGKVSRYQFQATLTDPVDVARSGLDVDHTGSFSAGPNNPTFTTSFTAPAGTPVLFYYFGMGGHGVSIPDPNAFTPLYESGLGGPTRGSPLFIVPRSGTYSVTVGRSYPGYVGELDEFAFRLIDLSTAPLKTIGSNITGTFAEAGRIAAFRFQGQAGQLIDFGTPLTGTHAYLAGAGSGLGGAAEGLVRLPQTGEYFLVIQNDYQVTLPTSYSVTLKEVTAVPQIALDTPITGQLTPGSGRQYFQISANEGDSLYFDDLGSSDKILVATQSVDGPAAFFFNATTLAANEGRRDYLRTGTTYLILDAAEADRPVSFNFRFQGPKTNTAPLLFGQTIQADFTDPIQTNVYTFDGTAGQTFYFDQVGISPLSPEISLTGPMDNLGNSPTLAAFSAAPERLLVLPQTGAYRLELRNSKTTTGSYSFRWTDMGSLPAVTSGTPQAGTFDPAGPVALYRVAATAGQLLTLDKTLGESDFRLRLFHPSGDSTLLSAAIDPVVIPIVQSGDYAIAVDNLSDNPFTYSFTATSVSDAPVTPENVDHSYAGTGDGSEQTLGTFTANAGTLLFMNGQAGVGIVNLYDASNNLVPVGLNSSRDYTAQLQDDAFIALPKSGAYTVKVQTSSDFAFRLRPADTAPLVAFSQNVLVLQSPVHVTELYRLNVTTGQTIQLDQTAGDGGQVQYQLFTAAGALDLQLNGRFAAGIPGLVTVAGTQFVTVTRTSTAGEYGFQIHDLDAAPLLTFGQPETGVANPASQLTIRRFNGIAGQEVFLDSNGGMWKFYDPQQNFYRNLVTNGIITLPATGVYTIERDNDGIIAPDDFTFTLSVVDETVKPIVPAYLAAADTSVTYDPNFNQPTNITNELGRQTLFDIDPVNGNTRSITRVVGAVGGGDDQVTTMTYLSSGLTDTLTDPLGRVTDYDYDNLRRLITVTSAKGTPAQTIVHYEYNTAGNVAAYIDENNRRTSFEYDALNRLKKVIEPDPDGAGSLTSPVTQFTYDAAGNPLTVIDANSRTTGMAYDVLDRLKSVTDSGNNTTSYVYDPVGNVKRVTDPLGHFTEYEYDSRNRVTKTTDSAGKETRLSYDLGDNLVSLTDASGNTTRFAYDARDRLISRTDPLGEVTKYTYDAADNLLTKTDRLGRITEFAYDDLDRPIQEVWRRADRTIANTITYAYDKANNLLQAQDNFSSVQYVYDALDRTTQTQTSGPNGIPSATLAYAYDPVGNRLSVVDTINGQAGGTNTYIYDALDRITRIVQNGAGVATKRVDLQYNPLGQMTSLARFADAAGATPAAASTFVYDTLNRISSITHKNAANSVLDSFAYQYDAARRITRITDIDGATDFSFDARDELTGASHADAANPDETYVYDATGNRLSVTAGSTSSIYATGPNNRLTSDGKFNYTYDDEGNLIQRVAIASGAVREFAYDHRNRLIRVTDRPTAGGAATQVVKYIYDLFDRRIATNVDTSPTDAIDGVVTTFVYDGEDVLVEFRDLDGSGPAAAARSMRYLHGPAVDQVLAQEDAAGNVHWHLADHLGTIHDLVNNFGQVVNHLKYDSYGNVIAESNPAITTRYGFTGRELDSETKLMYYRARYYDQTMGRFLTEDSEGFVDGPNLFAYVINQPTAFRDPPGTTIKPGYYQTGPMDPTTGKLTYEYWFFEPPTHQSPPPTSNPPNSTKMSPQAEANLNDMGRFFGDFFQAGGELAYSLADFLEAEAKQIRDSCRSSAGGKLAETLKQRTHTITVRKGRWVDIEEYNGPGGKRITIVHDIGPYRAGMPRRK